MNTWVFVLCGICIAIVMRVIPVFHGYDSNDITRVLFYDDSKQQHYKLVPVPHTCGSGK